MRIAAFTKEGIRPWPSHSTIDTHAHYFPEQYLKLIADHGKRCGATVATEGGKTFIQVGLLLRTGPITSHFIRSR